MATVSFASAHTPVMHPPANELLAGDAASSNLDCTDGAVQRLLTKSARPNCFTARGFATMPGCPGAT